MIADAPEISAVICTHNRERFLERCIHSLYEQTLELDRYEVVIVDNGSSDRTREICDRFLSRKNFRYIFEPVLGLSQARNTGWQNARGKYVGYLDDDAVAGRTWLESALWSFTKVTPIPEWVGGPIELEWEVDEPAWMIDEYRVTLGKVDWGEREHFLTENYERLGGGNSFYLLTILEKMQGFDTRLGRKKNMLLSGEETQFQHRLKELGGRMYYHPGIRIFHYVPRERTVPGFFYRRYYWGGVTDYIMSKTLKKVAYKTIVQPDVHGSRPGRLITAAIKAVGLWVPQKERIQSRIYFSYVLGWISAVIQYGGRKINPDKI